MLAGIKKALGLDQSACAGCDPAILAKCEAAAAGSVTPHDHHVFVKLAKEAAGAEAAGAPDEAWWPESVDKEPAIAAIAAAIKEAGDAVKGKVKVTAWDGPGASVGDVLVFPAGLLFKGLSLEQAPAAVVAALSGGAAAAGPQAEQVQGTRLFVCCHTARDERCGHVGPPLLSKLAELAEAQGMDVQVLRTSHVGGHVYAGNVLVYSPRGGLSAHSGDWYGGLHAGNAAEFLDALRRSQAGEKAVRVALRRWWRGCVGKSKDEQRAAYEQQLRDIEDMQ